jgi:CheY-like chemotaxis protein
MRLNGDHKDADNGTEAKKGHDSGRRRPFYQVSYARSGVEALQLVLQQQPDLVMMDICMPGLDGLDTCRLLKNAPETGHIPILMMSGLDTPRDEVTALDAGADAFVSKPISARHIQMLVDDLLCSHLHK